MCKLPPDAEIVTRGGGGVRAGTRALCLGVQMPAFRWVHLVQESVRETTSVHMDADPAEIGVIRDRFA